MRYVKSSERVSPAVQLTKLRKIADIEGRQIVSAAVNVREQWIVGEVERVHIVGCAVEVGKERRIAQVNRPYPVALTFTEIRPAVVIVEVGEIQFRQLWVGRNVEGGKAVIVALKQGEFRVVGHV